MTHTDSDFSIPDAERKINPFRRPVSGTRPDGTPDDNDRTEIGPTALAFDEWAELGLQVPNMAELREYRLQRVREQLVKEDIPAVLLFDPINVRYATDAMNMQVWVAHNLSRACFIPVEGPVVLWEFTGCEHVSDHLPLVDEVRGPLAGFIYFVAGEAVPALAEAFVAEVDELMRKYCSEDRRLAVDKMEIAGVRAMDKVGLEIIGGQRLIEQARLIKNENELNAMRCCLAACEASMQAMQEKLRPGMTENELWATLHYENIRRGGEWIETRLLSSGPRTNPWFNECGPRVIQEGDLVAFDTDMVGTYGYCADISRTWICGDVMPSAEQKELYQVAREEVMYNMELIKPGMGFQELSEKAFKLPQKYEQLRYGTIYHGIGLCDEFPAIMPPGSYEGIMADNDGVLQAGMTVCVESYIGEVGGREGVKLEDQVLVTETGYENLTRYPFEREFLS